MLHLIDQTKIQRVMAGVAAGTSDQTSSAVDMAGFEGCLFVLAVGRYTATQVTELKVQQSDDNAVADDYTDIADSKVGPLADADGGKLLVIDIFRPQKRYLKAVVLRETANAVIDGVIAIPYGPRDIPTSQHAGVIAHVKLVSPAEGTA